MHDEKGALETVFDILKVNVEKLSNMNSLIEKGIDLAEFKNSGLTFVNKSFNPAVSNLR
jgi:hypothetical protein